MEQLDFTFYDDPCSELLETCAGLADSAGMAALHVFVAVMLWRWLSSCEWPKRVFGAASALLLIFVVIARNAACDAAPPHVEMLSDARSSFLLVMEGIREQAWDRAGTTALVLAIVAIVHSVVRIAALLLRPHR